MMSMDGWRHLQITEHPAVGALLAVLQNNVSLTADLARQFHYVHCDSRGLSSSFLQRNIRPVPRRQHFMLRCQCAEDVKRSNVLPINLPLSSCASNLAHVKRIYTPGCSVSDNQVCNQQLAALDTRVRRYFEPQLAWRSHWSRVSEHHFSDFSGATHQPILGTPGGDLAELVVALAIYEGTALVTLSAPQVRELLRGYLSASTKRSFYFATDRASLEEIARLMQLDYLDVPSWWKHVPASPGTAPRGPA